MILHTRFKSRNYYILTPHNVTYRTLKMINLLGFLSLPEERSKALTRWGVNRIWGTLSVFKQRKGTKAGVKPKSKTLKGKKFLTYEHPPN